MEVVFKGLLTVSWEFGSRQAGSPFQILSGHTTRGVVITLLQIYFQVGHGFMPEILTSAMQDIGCSL